MRILAERAVRLSWDKFPWSALFFAIKPILISPDLPASPKRTSGPAWEGYACAEFYA